MLNLKKRYILFTFILTLFAILFMHSNCYAQDLDEIVDYVVTVDPRMTDGTLDIIYEITWKVLDSTTEGPLTWVQIGTPNDNFSGATALSNNIASITKSNGSFVKIYFKKAYKSGEQVKFRYSIHQSSMYKKSWGNCKFEFTPAWFTDIKVDNLTIRWNKDQVKSSNTKNKDESYLIWNKTNLAKGEKLTASVKYSAKAFSSLSSANEWKNNQNSAYNTGVNFGVIIFIIVIIAIIISMFSRLRWWRIL